MHPHVEGLILDPGTSAAKMRLSVPSGSGKAASETDVPFVAFDIGPHRSSR